MSVVYVPVFKVAVSYTVNVGRRWSIVEQLLLTEVSRARRGIVELAQEANLPRRLVAEALINLLRAGWVEVLATSEGVVFGATSAGSKRAEEEELPTQLHRDVRWISLCVERVTGAWFRSDDLELVYAGDLPSDAYTLRETYDTFDGRDLPRELLYLRADEALEPLEPAMRTPSRPYARIRIEAQGISGLPTYAPLDLMERLRIEGRREDSGAAMDEPTRTEFLEGGVYDTIVEDDLIVGGAQHLSLLQKALSIAKSTVIIHSCFIDPDSVSKLLPDFQAAAKRGIRVELLCGLYNDPESNERQKAVVETDRVLSGLPEAVRSRVKLSTISSRSHSKILLYDRLDSGAWEMVLGSCNYLSAWFNLTEVSIRFRNPSLIARVLNRLIATQQPASGAWPPMTVRLHRLWSTIRTRVPTVNCATPAHSLRLLSDREHYTCVTHMRDEAIRSGAQTNIEIGCDLYGSTAESSVLTPLARVAEYGNPVLILYRRPSKYLSEEGLGPDPEGVAKRNMKLEIAERLHGKYIIVGDDTVAVTSFNWLSTAVEGTRTKSAELGLLVRGPEVGRWLRERLRSEGVPGGDHEREQVTLDLFSPPGSR